VIVIADTSPLNYLIRLGHSDLLREIYGRVLIPPAVLTEMKHPEAPLEVRVWALQPPAWLETTTSFRVSYFGVDRSVGNGSVHTG
jgi:predicted nucleic acid-binding protein